MRGCLSVLPRVGWMLDGDYFIFFLQGLDEDTIKRGLISGLEQAKFYEESCDDWNRRIRKVKINVCGSFDVLDLVELVWRSDLEASNSHIKLSIEKRFAVSGLADLLPTWPPSVEKYICNVGAETRVSVRRFRV